MSKKVISLLLAVMLCVGLLPFGAFAESEEETVIIGEEVLTEDAGEVVTEEEVPADDAEEVVMEEEVPDDDAEEETPVTENEETPVEEVLEVTQDGATVSAKYLDADGNTQTATGVTELTAGGNYPAGWYILSGEQTLTALAFTGEDGNGDVHLILADGANVTVHGGILLANKYTSLTIYAQPVDKGTGKLTVQDVPEYYADIGTGNSGSCGDITINGGTVTANGGSYGGAGIGSGYSGGCGDITINGGTVAATGGDSAAGIGSGNHGGCGDITINGGTVTANGGENAAGIGSTYEGSCGDITINGGTVTANGGSYGGAGIGSSYYGGCGDITINGGTVTANGRENAAGIGSGNHGGCGDITITGGTVTANGGIDAAGIGGGYAGGCGDITINGGTVTANGGSHGAGIGSGYYQADCGDITVNGGYVEATGGDSAAGIGSGFHGGCGDITIGGGYVMATGGDSAAGIGPGFFGGCGKITTDGTFDTGEKDGCRRINYEYYPAEAGNHPEYFRDRKNGAEGDYYTAMPFTESCRIGNGVALEAWLACGFDHTPGDWEVTKEATCGEAGTKVKKCSVCHAVLETEAIPATGDHTPGDWEVTKEATCGVAGTKVKKCSVCHAVLKTEAIPATGEHTPGEWEVTKEATCGEAGTKVKKCSVCHAVLKTETIPATDNHTSGDWEVTKEATCGEAGTKVIKCSVCHAVLEAEAIPATGQHTFGDWVTVEMPTASAFGKARRECAVCHITEEKSIPNTYLACEEGGFVHASIPEGATILTSGGSYGEGWYLLCDKQTFGDAIEFTGGDVHIILMDGADIRAVKGVQLTNGASLTIHAQSVGENMGKLTATGGDNAAGIGSVGWEGDCGNITIDGGRISATGNSSGAGIGSAYKVSCGLITVNGGIVEAIGGNYDAAGIGSGFNGSCSGVIINGGLVKAKKGNTGAQHIGSGSSATCGEVSFGSCKHGEENGWYLVTGYETIAAEGPTCTKPGHIEYYRNLRDEKYYSSLAFTPETCIGGESNLSEWKSVGGHGATEDPLGHIDNDGDGLCDRCGGCQYYDYDSSAGEPVINFIEPEDVTEITDSTTTLTDGWYIVGGSVKITGYLTVAGDAHLILADDADLTVEQGIRINKYKSLAVYSQSFGEHMGSLSATGNNGAAGIGSGYAGAFNDITINGGNIIAQGGDNGAGIGGGQASDPRQITINAGNVTAIGGKGAAGIGGGYAGNCSITINGGTVRAKSGKQVVYGPYPEYPAGIGNGASGSGSKVYINGGYTEVYSENNDIGAFGSGESAAEVHIGEGMEAHRIKDGKVESALLKLTPDNILKSDYKAIAIMSKERRPNDNDDPINPFDPNNPVAHIHLGILQPGAAATENSAGYKDCYKCSCGKFFEDADCSVEITDLDAWKAKGGNGYIAPLSGDDEPTGGDSKQSPKTGDTNSAALWLSLSCVSALGAVVVLKKKKV